MTTRAERAKIVQAVDEKTKEIACFLAQLIQFDSETGREGPIQEFIAGRLLSMGLDVDQWVPDLTELAKHPAYIPAEGRDSRTSERGWRVPRRPVGANRCSSMAT